MPVLSGWSLCVYRNWSPRVRMAIKYTTLKQPFPLRALQPIPSLKSSDHPIRVRDTTE